MFITIAHFTSGEKTMKCILFTRIFDFYLKHDHWPCLLQEAPEYQETRDLRMLKKTRHTFEIFRFQYLTRCLMFKLIIFTQELRTERTLKNSSTYLLNIHHIRFSRTSFIYLVPKHFDCIQYNRHFAKDIDMDELLDIFSNDISMLHKSHK